MPDSVSLPFCVPWFACTQGCAAPGIAMAAHPTAYNGYLNQCTTRSCNRRFLQGYTSPQVGIPRVGMSAFNFFEKYVVASRFGHQFYKTIIIFRNTIFS